VPLAERPVWTELEVAARAYQLALNELRAAIEIAADAQKLCDARKLEALTARTKVQEASAKVREVARGDVPDVEYY